MNLTVRGSIPGMGKRFCSTPKHPDQQWIPTSILLSGP